MASGSSSRGLVLLLITSCFFITGILFDYMPMIIDDHIKRTIELATNEEILGIWSKPPVDINSYYWLYEIINADEFQREGQKAQVRQLGPFHFISRLEKRIVSLSANKFRLTYNSTRMMRLNESCSSDQLDRPITAPNAFYAAIIEGVRLNSVELDGQSRLVAYGTISKLTERYNESILDRNTTARRLLLGRPMPIVTKLARLAETLGMGSKMPELVVGADTSSPSPGERQFAAGSSPNGHQNATRDSSRSNNMPPVYGYVALQNNTLSGPFEIYTGYQETARSLGELISYKGKRRLGYYEGKCNRMQASAGELRPMPIDATRRLEMFSPILCRIVRLEPTGKQNLREGWAISYTLLANDFASAASNPDNRCYCTNSSGPGAPVENTNRLDDNHCSLDGVIDLGPCSYGAPLLMAPSSLQLDSRIVNSLGNEFDPELLHGEMNEIDQADDRSQIVILERVGVPIRADITMTLFLRLVRDTAFKETATIPDVSYLPLMTIRESITIPPKLAQIIINLESFISLTRHIKVVMYLSAVVLLFWLSAHYYGTSSVSSQLDVGPYEPETDSQQQRNRRQTDPQQQRRPSMRTGGGRPDSGGGQTGNEPARVESAPPASGHDKIERVAASNQRRASSFLNAASGNGCGRTLESVKEVVIAGGLASAVAKPEDTNSNDRANSSDSSRSLPPSRHTSRLGSLSEVSGQLEASAAAATSGGQTNDIAARSQGDAPFKGQPPTRPSARIFSKVDEQFETAGRGSKVAAVASVVPNSGQMNSANAAGTVDDTEKGPGDLASAEQPNGEAPRPASRRRRKNWFMNVYSNLVQMLNGLRGSISEAGQLETRPDSDLNQDKRLEMLAGKIDNWYNSNGDEPTGSAATTTRAANTDSVGKVKRSSGPNANQNQSATKTAPISSDAGDGGGGQTNEPRTTTEMAAFEVEAPEAGLELSSRDAQTRLVQATSGAIGSAGPTLSEPPSGATGERPQLLRDDTLETSTRSDPTGISAEAADFPSKRQFVSNSSGVADTPATTSTTTTTAAAATLASSTTQANEAPISSSSPSPPSSPPQVSDQTAGDIAGESLAEANPTERNGLSSRSMGVGSARAIDNEDVEGSTSTANTTIELVEDERQPVHAMPPPSGLAPNSPPSDGRRERKVEEKRGGNGSGDRSSGLKQDPKQRPAGKTALNATDEETETEPETELEIENESANELDKAKTLDQIEAALNNSDEEFAALNLKTDGGLRQRHSDPTINSSLRASFDSVADLERFSPATIDNKIKVLHRSKAPNSGTRNELLANGGQLAIDGLNSTDRLRQSRGLLTNGLGASGNSRAKIRENMTNNKHNLDGPNLKLVDELRDELDRDYDFETGQRLAAQMRTENSSNALVSNLSPKSSSSSSSSSGPQTTVAEWESNKMVNLIDSETVLEMRIDRRAEVQSASELLNSEFAAIGNVQSAPIGGQVAESNQMVERNRAQINHRTKLTGINCSGPTTGRDKRTIISPRLRISQIANSNNLLGSMEWNGNNTLNRKTKPISLHGGTTNAASVQRRIGTNRQLAAGLQVTSLKQMGGQRHQHGWAIQSAAA